MYLATLRALCESLTICEWVRDASGIPVDYRYLRLDAALERIGWPAQGLVGHLASEIFPDEFQSWVQTYWSQLNEAAPRIERYIAAVDRWYDVKALALGAENLFAVVFDEATERHRRSENRRFLNEIANDCARLADPDRVMALIGEKVAAFMNVTRCRFAEFDPDTETGRIIGDWHLGGVSSDAGVETPPVRQCFTEELYDSFSAGRPLVVEDASTDPRVVPSRPATSADRSFVLCPALEDGRPRFFVSVSVDARRHWRDDETAIVQELAGVAWSHLERTRTEQALRASEEEYRTLFEAMEEGYAVLGLIRDQSGRAVDVRYLELNAAHERMTGRSRASMIGRLRTEVIGRAESDLWLGRYQQVAETGEPARYESFAEPYGRFFDVSLFKLGANRIAVLYADISVRKEAEEALRENQRKYRALIETNVDFVWEMDSQGRYTYCSPQMEALWGLKPDDMIGKSPFELVPADQRQTVVQNFARLLGSPAPFSGLEVPSYDADGHEISLEVSGVPFFDDSGKLLGFRGVSRDVTERKRAAAALQASEALFHAVMETTSDPVYVKDREGRILLCNPALEKLVGKPATEIVGKTDSGYYEDEAIGRALREHDLEVMESGRGTTMEETAKTPEGNRLFLSNKAPYRNAAGEIIGIIGISHDITGRKQAEETLRESEERYRNLFESMDEGCALLGLVRDEAGDVVDIRYLELNLAHERQTGLGRENMQGRLRSETFGPIRDDPWLPRFQEVAETGLSARYQSCSGPFNGRMFDTSIFRLDRDRLAIVYQDVTNRKQAEDVLRHSAAREAYLLKLADALAPLREAAAIEEVACRVLGEHLAVNRVHFSIDVDGKYARLGRGYCQGLAPLPGRFELGQFGEEVVGVCRRGGTVVVEDAASDPQLSDLSRGTFSRLGVRAFVGTGLIRGSEWVGDLIVHSAVPRAWRQAEIELVQASADRIWSAAQRAEAVAKLDQEHSTQLEREMKARADAEAFVAVMSHELKTPITSVHGLASLLARNPGRDNALELATDIEDESERLVRIIDDLLVLSRVERGSLTVSLEPVLVQHVANSVVARARRQFPEVEIEVAIAPGLPPVLADETALRQVLHNLIDNAAKYGRQDISLVAHELAGHVMVAVRDRGPGAGPEPEALFSLYYRSPHTRKLAAGSGVGLYVCRELIKAMGGSLDAVNRRGGGAEFRVTLATLSDEDRDRSRCPGLKT